MLNQHIDLKLRSTPLKRYLDVDNLINTLKMNANFDESTKMKTEVENKVNE